MTAATIGRSMKKRENMGGRSRQGLAGAAGFASSFPGAAGGAPGAPGCPGGGPSTIGEPGANRRAMPSTITLSPAASPVSTIHGSKKVIGSPEVSVNGLTNHDTMKSAMNSHLGIDAVISPEVEVAEAIHRRLEVPGAFDAVTLADGRVLQISAGNAND